jgi:hypothetical protein
MRALDERIPTVKIMVRGGGGRGLRISLDDADLADWTPERAYPVNPGAHRVTVVPLGGVGVSKSATFAEGARASLEIELSGAAPAVLPTRLAGDEPAAPRPWLLPSLMGYGLGALGVGLGVGAGFAAKGLTKTVEKECPQYQCPSSAAGDLSAARGLGTASTVGFVLAGVGVAAGTVLLIVKPGASPQKPVALLVGPGSVGVAGSF